jgi:hypothetical protein
MADSKGGQTVGAGVKFVLCELKVVQEKRKCWTVSIVAPHKQVGCWINPIRC